MHPPAGELEFKVGAESFDRAAQDPRAMRLKPHAIDVRVNVDPVHWFLDGKDDTRSSYYPEDAATFYASA
jgi:hypothetical protein